MAETKPEKETQERERHGGGVVWALFLIFLGVIFLLNTLGVLPWGIWEVLWRFWPLLLILWGLQLILGGSWASGIAIAVTSILLFLAVIFMALMSVMPGVHDWVGQNWPWLEQVSISLTDFEEQTKQIRVEDVDYPGTAERDVSINIGAADFTLVDNNSSYFFNVDATYPGNSGEPEVENRLKDGTLSINFSTKTGPSFSFFRLGRRSYDFALGKARVPTSLEIDLGAGEGTINFSELRLRKLTSELGAGKLTITLGKDSIPPRGIILDVGAGSVVLNLPKSVGLGVIYDVGVGNLKINENTVASGLGKDGTYTSENYTSARTTLDIRISVGAGSVNIQTR